MENDIFDDILDEIPEELTLWQELWVYFKTKYFPRNVGAYENLGISPDDTFPIWCIIAAICLGLIFASLAMVLYKKIYGTFVEKMISLGAVGRDNARTLEELGYQENFFISHALKTKSTFHSVIRSLDEELFYENNPSGDYKIGKDDRFYIIEEKKYAAEVRFDTKGVSWRPFFLVCIVAVVGYFVIMAFLPQILTLLNQIFGVIL